MFKLIARDPAASNRATDRCWSVAIAAAGERQVERNGYGREEAERRVAAQIPIDEKRAQADYVIDNSGTLEETRRQVEALYRRLVGDRDERKERAC